MYHILVVTACHPEQKVVKQSFGDLTNIPNNIKISYLCTQMGNYTTILKLQEYLDNNSVDFILNVGVCGYKDIKPDCIQVSRTYSLAQQKESIVPVFFTFAPLHSIASSEQVVYDDKLLADEIFVDMESYGIEMVADYNGIPRMILKVPVDRVGVETKNFDIQLAQTSLRDNIDYQTLIEKTQNYLEKISQIDELGDYFTHFAFTSSQQHIFKKLFFAYKSLVNIDFEAYFQTHKNLDKKAFLSQLQTTISSYKIDT